MQMEVLQKNLPCDGGENRQRISRSISFTFLEILDGLPHGVGYMGDHRTLASRASANA